MIQDCYVVSTENTFSWFSEKHYADTWMKECREVHGQTDFRFTFSKCEINDNDMNDFKELEVKEVFLQ